MGDSGSYFIGYMLAVLSILGSIKSQAAFTFLIPVIAMGVPLLDTVWATIRRFVFGQKLFHPDKDHFHHRLLQKGLSHKRAVLVMYSVTVGLGCMALLMINYSKKSDVTALYLGVFAICAILFIRKLGYLNFLGLKNFLTWCNDLANILGINRDRRQFFSCQNDILNSPDHTIFWERIKDASKLLGLDYIEMQLGGEDSNFKKFDEMIWCSSDVNTFKAEKSFASQSLYSRFPLECEGQHFGVLIVSKKNFTSEKSHSYTLWRLEYLRRTLSLSLHKFKYQSEYELYDRRGSLAINRRIKQISSSSYDFDKRKRCVSADRRNDLVCS